MPSRELLDILRVANKLSGLNPNPQRACAALTRTRAALGTPRPRLRLPRTIAVAAALAAVVALAVGTLLLGLGTQPLSAAEALDEVASAQADYRGWVHATERSGQVTFVTHFNTDDGTLVVERHHDEGRWSVTFNDPTRGEQWGYDTASKELTVGRLSPEEILEATRRHASTTRPEGILRALREGLDEADDTEVKRRVEGDQERFEVKATMKGSEVLTIIVVDPRSRLVQKVITSDQAGQRSERDYRYGNPALDDVFDVGVPRNARLVDLRGVDRHATDGDAAVAELPPPVQTDEPVLTDEPVTLGPGELLALVRDTRRRIVSLQASYVYYPIEPRGNMAHRVEATAVVMGDKTYLDQWTTALPEHEPTRRVVAYDGRRSMFWHDTKATIVSGRLPETRLREQGFFELNLYPPAGDRDRDRAPLDLVTILEGQHSRVRPHLERVGEHLTHVVETEHWVLWLDTRRGGLPLRAEYRPARGQQRPRVTYLVEDTAVVHPGIWLATRGRKIVTPTVGAVESVGGIEYVIAVVGPRNRPALLINLAVPETFFDLSRSLPPGVRLWDQDEDQSYLVTPAGRVPEAEPH